MKTKFGAIIVAGSGKAGGHVFAKNRSGSYMRTKTTPVNPQSSYQTEVRNRLSALATAWGGLTAAQRNAWNGAVDSFKSTNVFGDSVKPSGFNLFVRLNSVLLMGGAAQIDIPPQPVEIPAITALSVAADNSSNTVIVTFAPTPVPADYALVIEATGSIAPGKSYVKNLLRQVVIGAAAEASPFDITTEYKAKFGDVGAVGNAIHIRAYFISVTTGQAGLPVVASTLIVA